MSSDYNTNFNLPVVYHPINTKDDCFICHEEMKPGTSAGHLSATDNPQEKQPLHIAHRTCILKWADTQEKAQSKAREDAAAFDPAALERMEEVAAKCPCCLQIIDVQSIEDLPVPPVPLKERAIEVVKQVATDVVTHNGKTLIGPFGQAVLGAALGAVVAEFNQGAPLAGSVAGVVMVASMRAFESFGERYVFPALLPQKK